MKDKIKGTIERFRSRCDYLEIRVEESDDLSISVRDGKVHGTKRTSGLGGAVRACYKGGWGFCSFNTLDEMDRFAETAVENARRLGSATTHLAPVEPVDVELKAVLVDDPRKHGMEEKVELLKGYCDLMLSSDPLVKKCYAMYFDGSRQVSFANSEGSWVAQEIVDLGLALSPTAIRDGMTGSAHISQGSKSDFSLVLGLEDELAEKCKISVALLDAPKVRGGIYPVVLDPHLGGVFVHEAFGHTSEADHQVDNPRLLEIFQHGARFGSDILNIYDTGLDEGCRGYVPYDDEGVPGGRTELIRDGIMVGRLHTRETAGKMDEKPTGNARAMGYAYAPICRMTNTCIAPGKSSFEELLDGIDEGVYAIGSSGGCGGEMFTFTASYGYMIRKGKVAELVRDVKLSGNLFHTLKNIDAIADDFHMRDGPGGCGKMGQFPLPVSHGSPHLRILEASVGGEQ